MRPDFEDNTVVMIASHPTSVEAQEKAEKAKAAKAANAPNASIVNLKSKQRPIDIRLEKGYAAEKVS